MFKQKVNHDEENSLFIYYFFAEESALSYQMKNNRKS